MISHIKKFVLISPPKTASVSLTDALRHVIDIKQIIPQIEGCYDYIESDNDLPAKHKTAEDYKKYTADYHVTGCVRNPFDRLVSWWKWIPKFDTRFTGYTFEDFLTHKITSLPIFNPQFNFFTINGVISVDTIIKFENLQQDFDTFCSNVNIDHIPLPNVNRSNRKCYTEYYDNTTHNIVASKYKKDIEYFGYRFGE